MTKKSGSKAIQKRTIILVLCLVAVVIATSAFAPAYPIVKASYRIYNDGTYTYAKNERTGQIDYQSTNASRVINLALRNLPSGRGKIYFESGVYVVDSPIAIPNGFIPTFEGDGIQSTIIQPASGKNINIFEYLGLTDTVGITFLHLSIDGLNTARNGIFCSTGVWDGLLDDVYIWQFKDDCIHLEQTWGWRIVNCIIEFAGNYGIHATGGQDFRIAQTKFLYNRVGLFLQSVPRASIQGCFFFQNKQHALMMDTYLGEHAIVDCIFNDNSHGNVDAYADIYATYKTGNVKVTGCIFDGSNEAKCAIWWADDRCVGWTVTCNDFSNYVSTPIYNPLDIASNEVSHNAGFEYEP